MEKKKRPGRRTGETGRAHMKTAGDTESKPRRPKQDHKGQGRQGVKLRRAKGE